MKAVLPEFLGVGEVPGIGAVRLRSWRDDDREAVLQAYRDPDIIRWVTQVPEPDDSFVRGWLRNRQESFASGSLIAIRRR
jgi:hypothetical protein